jgi:septum formation protein
MPVRLVLASASPRRAEILRSAGFEFDVRPSGAHEWPYAGGDPAAYALALALAKAAAVAGELVLAADTIVVVDGEVLGKPADAAGAASMLLRLSGRTHEVVTGVVVRHRDVLASDSARTAVTFRPLGRDEVEAYVRTGEPMDKAGSYDLQGGPAPFLLEIQGDLDTVIGPPLRLLDRLLPGDALRHPARPSGGRA